jgi:hypothetical protein
MQREPIMRAHFSPENASDQRRNSRAENLLGSFMKHLFLAIALAIPAYAGASELPREVSVNWAKYQAALKANDLPTLTSMAKFPVHCNEFNGDIKSAKEFAQQYKVIFPKPTKRCFETAVLRPQKLKGQIHYEAWCDVGEYPIRFIFEQVGSKLYLTSIDNVNE